MSVKDRLKKFIKSQNLTIIAFEKSILASNGYVNSISKGIGADKSLKINREYPILNMDWLLNGDGQMLSSIEPTLTNKHGNELEELEDGSFVITVDEIPFSAHASYLESLEAPLNEATEFKKVSFNVDHFAKGNYKGFKIKGDSMNGGNLDDAPDGASLLGREIGREHWLDGFRENKYGWIIISDYNIFYKDITSLNKEKGTITCHSRNKSPEYSDFDLELNSIKQIFKVYKRTF